RRGNDIVTYIVDRNVNYTNVCNVYCKFCAFYRTETDDDSYVITLQEMDRKIEETIALGGTQILMPGGHHPKLSRQWYLDLLGHVETMEDRIEHLERLRRQQDSSKGFTAFICWTFQAEHTKLRAPTVGAHEYLRTQALSRIYLDNFPSVQSSWVTQGLEIGQVALKYGANDLGSIMIEENVVSQAGTTFRMGVA